MTMTCESCSAPRNPRHHRCPYCGRWWTVKDGTHLYVDQELDPITRLPAGYVSDRMRDLASAIRDGAPVGVIAEIERCLN